MMFLVNFYGSERKISGYQGLIVAIVIYIEIPDQSLP